jgi:hypothetical protein
MENIRLKRQLQAAGESGLPVTPSNSSARQNFRSLSMNAVMTSPPCSFTPPPPTSMGIPHSSSFDSLHLQAMGSNPLGSFLDTPADKLLLPDTEDLTDMSSLLNFNW